MAAAWYSWAHWHCYAACLFQTGIQFKVAYVGTEALLRRLLFQIGLSSEYAYKGQSSVNLG